MSFHVKEILVGSILFSKIVSDIYKRVESTTKRKTPIASI
jgi:hypothetical protein